jgi:hypothetical protein
VRSARRLIFVAACIPVAATLLAGCKTTQDSNDRLELRAKRTLAGRIPIEVKKASPDVKVERVAAVRAKDGGAIVVALRNVSDHVVNDLPIEAGIGNEPLNVGKLFTYAQTRAPALDPGERGTWVFHSDKPLPAGTPFAKVGAAPEPALASTAGLPGIDAAAASRLSNSTLSVKITNKTDIPQYDLEVYAVARKGKRYAAAGVAPVEHLGSDGEKTVDVPFTGDAKGAPVQVFVSPVYFR